MTILPRLEVLQLSVCAGILTLSATTPSPGLLSQCLDQPRMGESQMAEIITREELREAIAAFNQQKKAVKLQYNRFGRTRVWVSHRSLAKQAYDNYALDIRSRGEVFYKDYYVGSI